MQKAQETRLIVSFLLWYQELLLGLFHILTGQEEAVPQTVSNHQCHWSQIKNFASEKSTSCPAPLITHWTYWNIKSSSGIFFHYTQWMCHPLKTSPNQNEVDLQGVTVPQKKKSTKLKYCYNFENFYYSWLYKIKKIYCVRCAVNTFSGTATQTTQAGSVLSDLFTTCYQIH